MLTELHPFLEPGVIYGIGALGLALIYRYLGFPDFTVLGSIVTGGIATVFFSNLFGPFPGLGIGVLTGASLGLLTGVLRVGLNIKPILAGVISFTASISVGYLLTKGGTIAFSVEKQLLSPVFAKGDLLKLAVLAVLLCIGIAALIATRHGALLLAMTAEPRFRRCRHRYQGRVFVTTVMAGNAIVALAGGLDAINSSGASVEAHIDFLPFSLAGIFLGNAVAAWAAKVLHKYEMPIDANDPKSDSSRPGRITRAIAEMLTLKGERPKQVFFLFLFSVLGTALVVVVSRVIQAVRTERLLGFSVDPSWQYIVVASLMALFAWWSSSNEEDTE